MHSRIAFYARPKMWHVHAQNPCGQQKGSCTANSLWNYYQADLNAMKIGTTPLYLVSRWGGGQPSATQVVLRSEAST